MIGSIGGWPVLDASINCGRNWTGTWTSALFDAPPPLNDFLYCNGSIGFEYPNTGQPNLFFELVELILNTDEDDDDIADEHDLCAGTAQGDVVDATGCSVPQICPCDGFTNHGQYVSCVADTANEFVDSGLITRSQRKSTLKLAAKSSCSK